MIAINVILPQKEMLYAYTHKRLLLIAHDAPGDMTHLQAIQNYRRVGRIAIADMHIDIYTHEVLYHLLEMIP